MIGAGAMGHGIAQIFAAYGYSVFLQSRRKETLSKALENIRSNLALMARHGIGSTEEIEPTLNRIKVTQDMAEAAAQADFVFESVAEDMDLKQNVFKRLDEICDPETVLATNTSVMSITEIAQKARHRERILGTHFWNPPYLLPLVEVVKTEEVSEQFVTERWNYLSLWENGLCW